MISHLGVFLVTAQHVGVLYFFNKKKEPSDSKTSDQTSEMFLCKFVIDGMGKKIGESVSVDNDILIIKSGMRFLGVPLKHIENQEKTLVVRGLVDFSKAYEMGEKWQKESCRDMNQKVNGDERKRSI